MAHTSNKPFMLGNTMRPKLNRSGKIGCLAIKLTLLNSNFDVISDQRVTLLCNSKSVIMCNSSSTPDHIGSNRKFEKTVKNSK